MDINHPGRLYFNVHGSNMTFDWYGDDGQGAFPVALQTSKVKCANFAVVLSEACYGAWIEEPNQSISYQFLQRGAGAFIGSTIIAWGGVDSNINNADLIASGFFLYLDSGETVPQTLRKAKYDIQEKALQEGRPLTAQERNTILSFIAYSGPKSTVFQKYSHSPKSRKSNPVGLEVSQKEQRYKGALLENIRKKMKQENDSILSQTRQSIKRKYLHHNFHF